MQLICGLLGHQPAPLQSRRSNGRLRNHCVLCQQPVERAPGGGEWRLADDPRADRTPTG